MRILISWIGHKDLDLAERDSPKASGPVLSVLEAMSFDRVILLEDYKKIKPAPREDKDPAARKYKDRFAQLQVFRGRVGERPNLCYRHFEIENPNDRETVFKITRQVVDEARAECREARFTFHLSPGTPAMMLAWVVLAPSYGATLIESSDEQGVQKVDLPYAIVAAFLPDSEIARRTEDAAANYSEFRDIIHKSPKMREIMADAHLVAQRDVSVLIEGETGTGKELFAKAIHQASKRSNRPLEIINCGAIPPELAESTLFGHIKSAFTGADKERAGLFQKANKGTVFLDEIGELSLLNQTKLLRVLEGRLTPLGADTEIEVDVRVIAATNRNLVREVKEQRFREDLLYRLATFILHLPPLRERGEKDIELLLNDALKKAKEKYGVSGEGAAKKFSDAARRVLLDHTWPGNVRELYSTVVRACVWSRGEIIEKGDAEKAILRRPEDLDNDQDPPNVKLPGEPALAREREPGPWCYGELRAIEKGFLERALAVSGGNKTKAAKLLGLSGRTFANRLKRK